MSCFHPMIAFPGKITENGKVQYIPQKASSELLENYSDKDWIKYKQAHAVVNGNEVKYPILLPCGKCIGCRLDKSREWALRCMMELRENNGEAFFLTLTYSDDKIPVRYYADSDTGEALPCYSLCLDDLQKFWKRLRKSFPEKKIRYFACGEYGEHTWRPHYHGIVFGFKPDDLRLYQHNSQGDYLVSDKIRRIWNNGNIIISDVSFNTAAYVARYTAKKYLTLEDSFFESHNLEKPFLVMSRRPGIGWTYLERNRQFAEYDRIYVRGSDPVDGRLPKSFLRKLEDTDPALFAEISEQRKNYGNVYDRAVAMSRKVPYEKLLLDAEATLKAQSKSISRKKV